MKGCDQKMDSQIISIISIIIALSSILLSAVHWYYDHCREKPKISLEARGYLPNMDNTTSNKYSIFSLIIKNESKFDIAITRIFLTYNNEDIEFCWQKNINLQYFSKNYQSTPLPLHILGMSAYGGYFFISPPYDVDLDKLPNAPFKIKLQTSRGHEFTFSFSKLAPMIDI